MDKKIYNNFRFVNFVFFVVLIKNTFYVNNAKDMPLSKHFFFLRQPVEIQNKLTMETFMGFITIRCIIGGFYLKIGFLALQIHLV